VTATGPEDNTVLGSTYAGFSYDVATTNALGSMGTNWLAVSASINGTWIYGRGRDDPEWVAASGNSASLPLFQLQQRAQQRTGSMQGAYEVYASAVDRFGNRAPGSNMPWAFHHDAQDPMITRLQVSGATPGGNATIEVNWADSFSARDVYFGVRLNHQDPTEAPFGQPILWLDRKQVGMNFPESWTTAGTTIGTFQIPEGVYITNQNGQVNPIPVGIDAVVAMVADEAGRVSQVAAQSVPATAATPAPSAPTTFFSASSVQLVSTGSPLNSLGVPTSFTLYADLLGSWSGKVTAQFSPNNGAGVSLPLLGVQQPQTMVGPYTRYASTVSGKNLFPHGGQVVYTSFFELPFGKHLLRGPKVSNSTKLLMFIVPKVVFDGE
jgi:hypothetical protein